MDVYGIEVLLALPEFRVVDQVIRPKQVALPLQRRETSIRLPYPEGELCDREGSYLPFAATPSEREAQGAPRPSLEERYGSHAAYVKQVEEAAQALVDQRLLLPQDAARYVDEATRSDPFISRT